MTQPTALNCSHCIMCNCRQTWSTYRNFHTPSLILYQFSSLLLLSVQREELKENSYQGYVIQNEAKSCCSFCEVFTHLPGDQFSLSDQFSSIKASLKSEWTTVRGMLCLSLNLMEVKPRSQNDREAINTATVLTPLGCPLEPRGRKRNLTLELYIFHNPAGPINAKTKERWWVEPSSIHTVLTTTDLRISVVMEGSTRSSQSSPMLVKMRGNCAVTGLNRIRSVMFTFCRSAETVTDLAAGEEIS